MMQNAALLTGVDDSAVVQLGELLDQLLLLGEVSEDAQDLVVDGTGAEVEVQAAAHGHRVLLDALSAVLTGHGGGQLDRLGGLQSGIGSQSVHVVPIDHVNLLLKYVNNRFAVILHKAIILPVPGNCKNF